MANYPGPESFLAANAFSDALDRLWGKYLTELAVSQSLQHQLDQARCQAQVWERAACAEKEKLEQLIESFGRGEHVLIQYGPPGTRAVVRYNEQLYDAKPMGWTDGQAEKR